MSQVVRVQTNAPRAYDYDYTAEVAAIDQSRGGRKFTTRIVEIPEEAAQYQMDRYSSGFYFAERVDKDFKLKP